MLAGHLSPRRGARRKADVPPDVLAKLEQGLCESANLMEWLRIDMAALASIIASVLEGPLADRLRAAALRTPGQGVLRRLEILGETFIDLDERGATWAALANHTSDVVRQWMVYAVNLKPNRALAERLDATLPFAADRNMSVRECAWMAFRPHLAEELHVALSLLQTHAASDDPNVRRFSIEVTRPRSVWGRHIPELKQKPELARPLLDSVRCDPYRYVQLAVGNWLNDASKSRPDWVISLCRDWQRCASKHTTAITKRGLRSIARKKVGNGAQSGSAPADSKLRTLVRGGVS